MYASKYNFISGHKLVSVIKKAVRCSGISVYRDFISSCQYNMYFASFSLQNKFCIKGL